MRQLRKVLKPPVKSNVIWFSILPYDYPTPSNVKALAIFLFLFCVADLLTPEISCRQERLSNS